MTIVAGLFHFISDGSPWRHKGTAIITIYVTICWIEFK